tara:strand:+ start:141 stop:461 length:321 start_codon:yes stop_codon:yes gene_type:complete
MSGINLIPNNTNNNNEYIENPTKQHLHDSWNLNKCSRREIDRSINYYKDEENYETCKERSREWYKNNLQAKKEYDKMYYACRKSWGEVRGYIITWNLLNISGDVFK